MATVKKQFLYGMITGEFHDHSTHGITQEKRVMAAKLQEATGIRNDPFMSGYAEGIQFTLALTFDWHNDAPEHYTAFEAWWKKHLNGNDLKECYEYLSEHVNIHVINEWMDAYQTILKQAQWKPPEEKMPEEGEDPSPKD